MSLEFIVLSPEEARDQREWATNTEIKNREKLEPRITRIIELLAVSD